MKRPPIIKFDPHGQDNNEENQHIQVIDEDEPFSNDSNSFNESNPPNVNIPNNCTNKKVQAKHSTVFVGQNEFRLGTKPPVKVTIEPSGSFSSLSPEDASKNSLSFKNHSFSLPSKNLHNQQSTSQLYATQNGHLTNSIHSLLNLRATVCKKNVNECDCETCANLLKDFMGQPDQLINESSEFSEPKATYSYLKSYFVSMLQPSDNKLAMKLFGSKKGVLKEKLRQQEVGHWIIHPCSNFRFYWDLVMLILLIANVIILPVAISFFNDNWSHTGLLIFNLVSDSLFLLDIVVNFRTGK